MTHVIRLAFVLLLALAIRADGQTYVGGLKLGAVVDGECLKRVGADIDSVSCGGGAAWGGITGTLSDQTDLQTVLDGKEASGTFSGVGACGVNTWASTLVDNTAPTCTQPGFSNLSGAATDAQVPNTITLDNLTQVTTRAISDTTGTLAISRGGTNATATPTAGGVAYGTGTAYAITAAGTASQCLLSGGAGTPTWGSCAAGGSGKAMFNGKSSASLTTDTSCSPQGYDVCAAASGVNQVPVPFAGTLRNLYLEMVTAPANGSSCKLLVRAGNCSNGTLADTALTCTVTGNGSLVNCNDTSNTAAVTAGQCVQLFYDETGTCTGVIRWAFELTPS